MGDIFITECDITMCDITLCDKNTKILSPLAQLVMLSGLQILFRDAEVVHVGVQTWIETHEEGTS